MKLLKTKSELTEARSVSGLLTCTVKHEIKSTSAVAAYDGPKIPYDVWQSVLAFLKWVNDTTHSEGQVRLYVNPKLETWKAWAYPQEAKTGMSAKELDNDDTKKQREQFKDSEGWVYFGTVHSHCSMGAFQSSTDESNESNQDGLHITIGHLDKEHYDLHARFYRSLLKFEPDLSEFWDIGEPWKSASEEFVNHAAVAKWQMSEPDKEAKFPEEWKANLIEIKPVTYESRGLGNWQSPYSSNGGPVSQPANTPGDSEKDRITKKELREIRNKPLWQRQDLAAEELEARFTVAFGPNENNLIEAITFLCEPEVQMILKVMEKYEVDADDLEREFKFGVSHGPTQYGLPATGLGSMMD